MRERFHLLLREPRLLPALDPRPSLDIRNRVLALAVARKIVLRLIRVLAAEMDLQHTVHPQRLVLEARDGVGNLLWGGAGEVIHLALVGGTAAVPEEGPLQGLVALEIIGKAEFVFFVGEFEEVEEFSGGFMDGEGWGLGVVDEEGDAACGGRC